MTPEQRQPFVCEVDEARERDVVVVRVAGELDLQTSPRFAETLAAAMDRLDRPLVVDLVEVGFMDSTGISTLLSACHRATRGRCGFAVACADPNVMAVFEMMRLVDTLRVTPDLAQATAAATRRSDELRVAAE